jgi:hypothetical protein
VIATSIREATCQGLQFSFGVHPVCVPERPRDDAAATRALLAELGVEGRLALVARSAEGADAGYSSHLDIIDLESSPAPARRSPSA